MKKHLFFFTMLAIFGLSVNAQNNWAGKQDLGVNVRSQAVGFSIGSKGYIGSGSDGGMYSDFWEYDPSTNVWTQKADFGGGVRKFAVGFSIGNKGYVGTGRDADIGYYMYNDFWEYNPINNKWTQKANFLGVKRFGAVGFSIGSKGYIGTGESTYSTLLKDFFEYDPVSDSWSQKADFGGGLREFAVGFSEFSFYPALYFHVTSLLLNLRTYRIVIFWRLFSSLQYQKLR